MALSLRYPDKYRLWSDLIQGNTDRVFVASSEEERIGARVPVELVMSNLPARIVINGTIIGRRRVSGRFSPGVYLRFTDDEIEKCRRFLGLAQTRERYEHGRKARRRNCTLRVGFKTPPIAEPAVATNLSESGLLVTCAQELHAGQQVLMELTLDDGTVLLLRAEVSRTASARRPVGLRLVDPSEGAVRAINAAMKRLERTDAPPAKTVLVADDDPPILEFLTKSLTRYGYQVYKARRGEEALALVRELKPQLVVLDILMPGIDGVDVCKMMRADVEMADIPVVFLSALDADRLHAVADQAGATDYMAKPVALADLMNTVGSYLR